MYFLYIFFILSFICSFIVLAPCILSSRISSGEAACLHRPQSTFHLNQ